MQLGGGSPKGNQQLAGLCRGNNLGKICCKIKSFFLFCSLLRFDAMRRFFNRLITDKLSVLILMLGLFATVPIEAQSTPAEKQGKFDINVGISDPGLYYWNEDNILYFLRDGYWNYDSTSLDNIEVAARRVTAYPNFSIQCCYMPTDHGFFKRIGVVGMTSFSTAKVCEQDLLTGQYQKGKIVHKSDILVGMRIVEILKPRFRIYSQALIGYSIFDGSDYWDSSLKYSKHLGFQVGYVGIEFKPFRKSDLTLVSELGFGTESAGSDGILFRDPGIRFGVGYKF